MSYKKCIATALLPIFTLSFLIIPTSKVGAGFTDTDGTAYKTAITHIQRRGIVEGYADGSFRPGQTINRAELLKILIKGKGWSAINMPQEPCFTDVRPEDWFAPYVCEAKDMGVVQGYADGSFRPAQNVNFVEALKMIVELYGITKDDVAREPWYRTYVDAGARESIIPLTIQEFGSPLKREEMADMMIRKLTREDGTQESYLKEAFGENATLPMSYQILSEGGYKDLLLGDGRTLYGDGLEIYSAGMNKRNREMVELREMKTPSAYNETPITLAEAKNKKEVLNMLGVTLSKNQETFLNEHKFLLIPSEQTTLDDGYIAYDDMLNLYDSIKGEDYPQERKPENAKLITPDVMLHAYHKYYENTLEKLEEGVLGTELQSFLKILQTQTLLCAEGNPYLLQSSTEITPDIKMQLRERCAWVSAQLTVARVLLENAQWDAPEYFTDPEAEEEWYTNDKAMDSLVNAKKKLRILGAGLDEKYHTLMEQELEAIYAAEGVGASPLYVIYNKDLKTDYTQFTPRSHYTKTSKLRAYFRTMMYLGRSTYAFGQTKEGIQDALLLTLLIGFDENIADSYMRIMELTSLYAGEPDDITQESFANFIKDTFQVESMIYADIVDDRTFTRIKENLSELPSPRILSDIVVSEDMENMTKEDLRNLTKGFRIFGQRFSQDAYILNQLTQGAEQSDISLPSMPSSLFVGASLGNDKARTFMQQFLEKEGFTLPEVKAIDEKMLLLRAMTKGIADEQWYRSFSGAWLKVLSTLEGTYGKEYPLYMQSSLFGVKNLETLLGSYTELKHDTVLYAKQSYAELGAGMPEGPEAPIVKGFVEPNLKFWYEFERLVNFTGGYMESTGQTGAVLWKIQEFADNVAFLRGLAEKEWKGEKITDEEYEQLRTLDLEYMAEPLKGGLVEEEEKISALVTDIHTDGVQGKILYQGTAKPYVMLVLVANEGSPRLVVGVTYNHYEFTGPLSTRLNDQDWQKKVEGQDGGLPAKSFWYKELQVK